MTGWIVLQYYKQTLVAGDRRHGLTSRVHTLFPDVHHSKWR